ncbi:MAG TPA: amino acid adenylation domain-containing protein [Candidatus Saccharimonadales bacterium]|jgi:amino acid adenylation domain-containing protein|nr:amino acid adenylation domain-containing protein [Candidatus Saccharimonadales bacterium]
MAELTERIAALTPEQRELLKRRLQQTTAREALEAGISRLKRDTYPLSFSQQRLWFLDAYHQGSPFYNFSLEYEIIGPLNSAALRAGLAEVVRRHEILRTIVVVNREEPLQTVQPAESWQFENIDLQGGAGDSQQSEADRLMREAARRSLDLGRGPLFCACLMRMGPAKHRLQIVVHHIAFDGWSIKVLVQELEALYAAFSANRPSPLSELPVQYGDFAAWQRERLRGDWLSQQLEYWKKTLAGLIPFELTPDHPRPALQTYGGAVCPFRLSLAESRLLATWSRRQRATLFMTLLAAVKTLLLHRSGREDIALATAVANRNRVEIEELIGFFVNTLVLRTDLIGNPSFQELVGRVRDVVVGAQAHQDVPFEKLVEELQPARDPSRNPLVQILFVLQEQSVVVAPRLNGLEVKHLSFRSVESTRFDLEFHLWETDRGLDGIVVYNTDLFEPASAERLSLHLQAILSAIVVDPSQKVLSLPRMDAGERAQLLNVWSCGADLVPMPCCLHELVEQQVRRTPEAVAVTCQGLRLTYSELNQRANRLAHHLRYLGVRAETRVGICLHRSLDMVVALLGVLKAGGAYVPMDPAYPQERLRYVLEDAQIAVLLIGSEWREKLPASSDVAVIEMETLWDALAGQSSENPAVWLDSASLAYVIYTSGSTGRPKGVGIQHGSAVVFSQWSRQIFTDEELSMVVACTSICFDLSVFEIFVPLSMGGTVFVVNSALDVAGIPAGEQVKLINTVPSAMAELIQANALPDSISTVNLAGEALQNSLVQQIYQHKNIKRVLNLYGPSEDTTYSTYACLRRSSEIGSAPIGTPIAGAHAYVLDSGVEQQLAPVGTVGELYLGGRGLARGYLNRPELTAERFVPDSFSNTPGARLYRTGDRVRWLANGELEFLGRLDHQVKIRGYRIELGEIEAALLVHPAVGRTVVVAREDTLGVKQLVAYWEGRPGVAPPQSSQLREYLLSRLPGYMVPSFFVVLDRLPLNPNGKIDRQQLRAPADMHSAQDHSYLPPRDSFELHCAQIWEQVLGISQVGLRDNFFELGGHSLNAFVVMTRIRKVFGRDLPISVLFQGPTVEHLAGLLRDSGGEAEFSPLVPIQTKGTKTPFFCVHPAGGNVLCYIGLSRHLGSDQPFYGLQSRSLVDEQLKVRSAQEMAADYIEVVRKLQPQGPYHLGGYCLGGVFAFEMACQLRQMGEEVAALVLIDTFSPEAMSKEEFDDAQALSWFGRDLGMPLGKRLSIPPGELRGLPAGEAFEKVLAKAKQEEVLPMEASSSQLRRYFHCYLANSVYAVTYEPRPYHGRITLLSARDEEDKHNFGASRGWESFTDRAMTIKEIPGDHASIIFEPNVQILAGNLRQALDGADAAKDLPAEQNDLFFAEKNSFDASPLSAERAAAVCSSGPEIEGTTCVQHSYMVTQPIKTVFDFLANPRLEPQWNPWIQEVKMPPGPMVTEGTSFVAVYSFMGREFEMKIQIERHVAPTELTLQVVDGPFLGRTAYTLARGPGDTTHVDVRFLLDPKDFFGIIPKALLKPLFHKSLKDDCRRQKALMERAATTA